MLTRSKLLIVAAAVALVACGPRRPRYPSADAPPLGLDRVVLYRNGVGYFERAGTISGDIMTIKVRKDQVNDLLKSLTVVERKSGRAVSVSMPLDPQTWANAALATLRPGQGSLAAVLDALRGSRVTLHTVRGSVRGRIALVEQLIGGGGDDHDDHGPRVDHRVSLLDGGHLSVVRLSDVRGMRLEDGDLAMQFNRTLDASAGEGMFQQVAVSIRLAGASSHDLMVSYVVAAPMWKPTYRVVLPEGGKGNALLQGWAVVDNTSGEEWHQVRLALTSGAPIAFRYDLHTPRDIPRPDLTGRGVHRQADAMVGESTYLPPPAPEPTADKPRPAPSRRDRASGSGSGYGRGGGGTAPRAAEKGDYDLDDMLGELEEDERESGFDAETLRRSTQAQARATSVSGQTRFEIDGRVTVPDGTSTMVAVINADVEGEEAFLFRPGGAGAGYQLNPYRVVRFKNSTPFVLEPGPISIYSGGSFVGEGLSETVSAGTSATVPFAVETGVQVTSKVAASRDQMRLVRMSRGVLEVEQFARRETTYTARAQTLDEAFTVLVRHGKAGGSYELATRPTGTEDLPDAYLIRLPVAAGKREGSVTVVERTPSRTSISIWNKPALDILEKLLVDADLGADTRKRLQPIIDRRRNLARIEEQLAGLSAQRDRLDQRAAELRSNLAAIAKNPAAAVQRRKWTKQLDDFTSEGNRMGAQLAELEAKRLDQRVELENALQDFELVMPAAKPAKP